MKIFLIILLLLFGTARAHSQDDPDPQGFFSKVKSLEEWFAIMEKGRPVPWAFTVFSLAVYGLDIHKPLSLPYSS